MFRYKTQRELKTFRLCAYESSFFCEFLAQVDDGRSDVYLHNINFLCASRYLTKMLYSLTHSRVCIYFSSTTTVRSYFLRRKYFSVGDLVVFFSMFAFRSAARSLCVYAIRLCAFMFARIETREEKIFRSIIIGRRCVCGWVVFVSLRGEMCPLYWWKIAICFFLWTIGKFNFQFSTTRHSTISQY